MKELIPGSLRGKELFRFLIANKQSLIKEKKSIIKRTEPLTHRPSVLLKDFVDKSATGEAVSDPEVLRVKVVANTANWIDSQMDMLVYDCWKESIKSRIGMIPHLHDHIQKIEAKVGEVVSIYSQELSLKELGLNQTGSTQALIFETDVMKSYNAAIFNQYKLNRIHQHSIGLQYVNISLCINDDESEKEFEFWNKYYPLVLNKEVADEYGFFWVVSEIKLLENSCVLFGANELTPTLYTDSIEQPAKSTVESPSNTAAFDLLAAISETKFI